MLRMDECNKIRKEFHVNGKSKYQIAKDFRRSWASVDKIVSMDTKALCQRGKRPGKKRTVITPEVERKIQEFLDFEQNKGVHKKQRFTAVYIFKKLKEEQLYQGSSKRLRTTVARMRKERKQEKTESFLHLDFEFGQYLQVDHGPVEVSIQGLRLDGYLFVASVPGTSLRYCQFYPTKAQEAWGHFHESSFTFFGGTFANVIYDNDSVLKINRTNEQTSFCIDLQAHYGFKAIFCNKAAGHEKGAVECSVGFCRRNFLAGLQDFESFQALNTYLENQCLEHLLSEKHYQSKRPLHEIFDELKIHLCPMPSSKSWGHWEDAQIDRFQCGRYQERFYSVPEKYIGANVKMFVTAFKIEIYDGLEFIHSHDRLFLKENTSLILDHYLDQLLRKPRSVHQAKVLKQTCFETHIETMRQRLTDRLGEKQGAKEFIQILILKRVSSLEDFHTSIQLALNYHAISFLGVQSILNQLQTGQKTPELTTSYPDINHHFNLGKYAELEQKEYLQ